MNSILIIHPNPDEVKIIGDTLDTENYNILYSETFSENKTYLKNNDLFLILLSTRLEEMDCLECLKENHDLLKNKVILINFNQSMDYILECLSNGAVHFFDLHFNEHELKTLVQLHFKKFYQKDRFRYLNQNIVQENKKLVLTNYDIYNSDRIDIILDYITASIKPLFDKEQYIGVSNAIYEILVNAMEHGNLGINSEEKEKLLQEGKYSEYLLSKLKSNKKNVFLNYVNNKESIKIVIEDMGDGFDFQKLKSKKNQFSLSGRGIPIASFFFDDIKYSKKGNSVTLIKKIEDVQS